MSACPHFFIVRPDGTKAPLIAVDELPSDFHILGVPPFITDAQTHGMVSLGLVPSSGRCYVVQQDEKSSPISSASLGPSTQSDSDKHGPGLPTKYTASDVCLPKTEGLSPAQNVFHDSRERCGPSSFPHPYSRDTASGANWPHSEPHVDGTQAIIDALTRAPCETAAKPDQQPLEHPVAGSPHPARGKKIYCNYWLRKGECDYMQQGCLYKHEMPLDKVTLASLGLREVPRWYRERWASVATSARTQREDHVNRPWRAPSSTPSFPDVQLDAPGAQPLASTITEPTHIRQKCVLPALIRPEQGLGLNEQRQPSNSNSTISSTTQNCDGSKRSNPGILKRINRTQPAQPGSIAPNIPITPTRARGQYLPAERRPESSPQHPGDHALSVTNPPAAVPAMMPSQAPLKRCSQEALCHVLSKATFYPGLLRTASPAHPRLFVKDGQGKYAVNQSVESQKRKSAVGRTPNSPVVQKQSSKTLNVFGDLGI